MNAPARDRSEALARLAGFAPHLRDRGVTSLRVFGSAGQDARTDESDVDILIEFDRPIGAFEYLDLQDDRYTNAPRPPKRSTMTIAIDRPTARAVARGETTSLVLSPHA